MSTLETIGDILVSPFRAVGIGLGALGSLLQAAYYTTPVLTGLAAYRAAHPVIRGMAMSGLAPKRALLPVPEYAKELIAPRLGLTISGKQAPVIPPGLARRAWFLKSPEYVSGELLSRRIGRIGATGAGLLAAYLTAKTLGIL